MSPCCLELVTKIIKESTFEPLILCTAQKPLAINERALELFEYEKEEQFLELDVNEMIKKHFTPSLIKDKLNGKVRVAALEEICFAVVTNYSNVKQTAVVKVKSWKIEEETFYSIGIRDIPILKLASDTSIRVEIIDRINQEENIMDTELLQIQEEPDIEKRLLKEFADMADTLPSLIWIMGNQGDVHWQNLKVQETFGVNTVSEGWEECIHSEDKPNFFTTWTTKFKNKERFSLEVRYGNKIRLQNEEGYDESCFRWHFFQASPILDKNGSLKKYIVNAVDIQDLKEAEAEKQRLIASERLAVESSKLKSAFLSMMSHEIRTPLFGIVGNTCLLLDTKVDPLQLEYIENIDGSAKLMMAVIQDILDFSRIEAGNLHINPEPFSVNKILTLFYETVKRATERKKLDLEFEQPSEDIKAIGDSTRILQVLTNLVSNAIKFTKAGKVSIKLFSFIDDVGLRNLQFSVQDSGIGIEPELMPKIFTPWIQADSSLRRLYGGSGLGLAITKSLIDMMNGEIHLISEVGVGTKVNFNLKLDSLPSDFNLNDRTQNSSPVGESKFEFYNMYESPLVIQKDKPSILKVEVDPLHVKTKYVKDGSPSPPSELKNPDKQKPQLQKKSIASKIKRKSKSTTSNDSIRSDQSITPSPPNNNKKFKLLLAEDNPINQKILKRFLDKMGCIEYFLAQDGVIALEEYFNHPPGHYDIILLDQSMPRMDGDMVCQKIREIDPNQIIISVSANTLLSDHKHYSAIGMNDHISKPVTFHSFNSILSKWMEQISIPIESKTHSKFSDKVNLPQSTSIVT